jgi:hypothetical protein
MTDHINRSEEKIHSINRKHPVHDFLTDEVVRFLVDIKHNNSKHVLIILTGSGNGKSCFMDIIQKVFNSLMVPCSILRPTQSLLDPYVSEIKQKKPDILLMQEPEYGEIKNLNILMNPTVLVKFKSYGVPIIIASNEIPESLKNCDAVESEIIKIIEFKNQYYNHLVNHELFSHEQVVNDAAVEIIKNILAIKNITQNA